MQFEPLPDVEPIEWIVERPRHRQQPRPDRRASTALIELCYEACQYHFELLNLGYVAYLDFFGFCKEAFPGISDQASPRWSRASTSTSSGPTTSCGGWPSWRSSWTSPARSASRRRRERARGRRRTPRARRWLGAWEAAQDPWFNFSVGQRLLRHDRVWLDHLDIPLRLRARLHPPVRGGRGHRPAHARRSPPSATASRASTASCSPTTSPRRRSTRSSASRGSCSPTSRITSSTSSTGRWRRSGARSASSARVARRRAASGPRPTTSSTSAATSCTERSTTTARLGVGADADRARPLAARDRPAQARSSPRSSARRRRRR